MAHNRKNQPAKRAKSTRQQATTRTARARKKSDLTKSEQATCAPGIEL